LELDTLAQARETPDQCLAREAVQLSASQIGHARLIGADQRGRVLPRLPVEQRDDCRGSLSLELRDAIVAWQALA